MLTTMTTMIDVPRGLAGVAVAETAVGDVRGEEGFYHYHQFDATGLARTRSFEDVWRLLIDGNLPANPAEAAAFRAETGPRRVLPAPVDAVVAAVGRLGAPDAGLRAVMAAVGAAAGLRPIVDLTREEVRRDGLLMAAPMSTAVAALYRRRQGLAPVPVDPAGGLVEDYLRQLSGEDPAPEQVRALQQYLVTTIDHGFNNSTFTARVVASSGADTGACVVAAMGALSGPRHGGAPSRALDMLDAIGTADRAEAWVQAELDAGRRIPGFGHPVYRTMDPRSVLLAEVATGLGGPRVELATQVEATVRAQLARRHPERPLDTNVEFWASIVLEGAGVPPELFTSTFAVARVIGWTAHSLEQADDTKIIRPSAHYVGPEPSPA
jgi:citrate synthase